MATAPSSELLFKVSGMTCAGCAATVQRAIEERPDVESASVNVTSGLATVTGEGLTAEPIILAIRDKGYDAEPIETAVTPRELLSDIEIRQRHHERMWRYRAIVGLGLWVPLELMHWFAPDSWGSWMPAFMMIGSTVVIAFAGYGFYRSAIAAARRRTTNMDTLIALGSTTAYVYSLIILVLVWTGLPIDQPLYFAEAAGLMGIVSLGHWFEARASAKAGSAVRDLLQLQPDTAERIAPDGSLSEVPSAEITPGDRLLVRPGGRIPVDGIVVEGRSEVDESIVTGESLPVDKSPGDSVIAGAVNTTGRLVVEAEVDGAHTTIARIAEIVQRAQSSKAAIQRLADLVSAVFVPTVLAIAVVTLLAWWLVGHDFAKGVISAVTVLIISCPCALGLATPMAVMVGTGDASKRGILIKSAAALERAGRIERVIFDKTGTLTAGRPAVLGVDVVGDDGDEASVLQLAAAVESPSEHPIAQAIVIEAQSRGITIPPVIDFRAIPGRGVRGVVDGRSIEVVRDEAATCQVVIDGTQVGTIMLADAVRPDAREALDRLREQGLSVRMLSGDKMSVAREIGASLGLDEGEIVAEVAPEQKAIHLGEISGNVMMVGDGINDAGALATAHVGVAMSSGTNVAIESADVVIPGDRVCAVPDLIGIARATLWTIRQNLFFAFFYNAAAIPAAAFGLLGESGPLWAALAMGASDITVIGNALRLKVRLSRSHRGPGQE